MLENMHIFNMMNLYNIHRQQYLFEIKSEDSCESTMQNLQQTVFKNIGKQTKYLSETKKINEKHLLFPKYRDVQIRNQFQIVDLHNQGELTKGQIIQYLQDKYQWVNMQILNAVLNTMNWDFQKQTVTKEEFTKKYFDYEKRLYREIYALTYHSSWVKTLQNIFNNETNGGKVSPRVYFYIQITNVDVYHKSELVHWMDIKFIYQNHEKKIDYQIWQACHEATDPSFEVWLPSQNDSFFLKFVLLDTRDNDFMYGQGYLSIPLEQKIERIKKTEVPITKGGKKVGSCQLIYRAQTSIQKVREQLDYLKREGGSYKPVLQDKTKEYQYLQFLWGVRHRAPHQVSSLDIKWMLIIRAIVSILIGVLGLIVHINGRCQPLCLILSFLILKNYNLVLLRSEKFMMTWLTLAAIMVDIIWLTLSSSYASQINFIHMGIAKIVTFFLLGIKVIYFLYMLIMEKSFLSDKQQNDH